MYDLTALRERLRTQRPVPWDQLPDFSLYMDQVLSYMDRQVIRFDEDDGLTAAMVNNYTKSGLVPRAEGKKYNRDHLAYLTAICVLKRVMSTRDMDLLIREELQGDRPISDGYAAFCGSLNKALNAVADEMEDRTGEEELADAAIHFALMSYAAGVASSRYVTLLRQRQEAREEAASAAHAKSKERAKKEKDDFVILTDSCCDMTARMAADLELEVLPLSLNMEDRVYHNYLDGREIGFQDFYARLRAGALATTSAISVGVFDEAMRKILDSGRDVLYLAFSSALSTTYQSAVIAADDLREAYPGRKIFVVDTLSASLGQGLLVYLCVQEKRKGKTIDQVHVFAEETKAKVCHWFTVDDLNHLKRGGRVSAAAALFGTMLSIKPVLHVDDTGHLVPVSKTRGRKASLLALVDRMAESAVDPAGQTIFISHGDCEADAEFVADEVRRRFGVQDIYINYVGPVIGNHSGPGTLALFFLGSRR